jgi:hypothetical protein
MPKVPKVEVFCQFKLIALKALSSILAHFSSLQTLAHFYFEEQ